MDHTLGAITDEPDALARLTLYWTEAQVPTLVFIRSLVRNRDDADDILQQTAYTLAKRFGDYDPARPFLPWAIGIARLKVMEYYHRHQRLPLMLSNDAIDEIASMYGESGEGLGARGEALEHCIKSLNERARALVNMRYGRDMKPIAIAKQLGTTANTVSNALSRVRIALRRCINSRICRESSR